MRLGGLIIFFFLGWIAVALWGFVRAKERSTDAMQTAAYIVAYPIAVLVALEAKPLPAVAATVLVMAGIPWLMAGVHLAKILKDPSQSTPGTFAGLPAKLWVWGIVLSVGVGLIGSR